VGVGLCVGCGEMDQVAGSREGVRCWGAIQCVLAILCGSAAGGRW